MPNKEPFIYEGFSSPNTTPTPNDVYDILAPQLTEAELRVLLYVIRRTFGFQKNSDAISTAQMANGITTRDGRQLDYGTGMSKSAVWRGCKGLVEKGILIVEQRQSEQGDSDVNVYSLHFREGVTLQESNGYSAKETPVTLQKSTQKKVVQEKVKQSGYTSRKRKVTEMSPEEWREYAEKVKNIPWEVEDPNKFPSENE